MHVCKIHASKRYLKSLPLPFLAILYSHLRQCCVAGLMMCRRCCDLLSCVVKRDHDGEQGTFGTGSCRRLRMCEGV